MTCIVSGPNADNIPSESSHAVHAVLEETRPKKQTQTVPISGPELAARMKIGVRVVRGVDWKWGDQVTDL